MFGTNVTSGLTLTKVLGGISRGLSIANQVIPLYQQVKPMVQSAKKVIGVLGELNKTSNSNNKRSNATNKTTVEVTPKEKTEPLRVQSTNNPVFFQ